MYLLCVDQRSPTFLAPGTSFVEHNFSTDGGGVWGEYGSGGNASDGSGDNASNKERWGEADEASLTRLPLTSCCVDHYWSAVWGLGTPGVDDSQMCFMR